MFRSRRLETTKRGAALASPRLIDLDGFTDGEDVAIGILEPRAAAAPDRGDGIDRLKARHVVFLELHPALLQVGDVAKDVRGVERHQGVGGLSGKRRGIK